MMKLSALAWSPREELLSGEEVRTTKKKKLLFVSYGIQHLHPGKLKVKT